MNMQQLIQYWLLRECDNWLQCNCNCQIYQANARLGKFLPYILIFCSFPRYERGFECFDWILQEAGVMFPRLCNGNCRTEHVQQLNCCHMELLYVEIQPWCRISRYTTAPTSQSTALLYLYMYLGIKVEIHKIYHSSKHRSSRPVCLLKLQTLVLSLVSLP